MTDSLVGNQSTDAKPIWARTWFLILAGVSFAAVMIFADRYKQAGTAEWSMIFALALGLSAVQFWNKRQRWWFWLSVAALALAHGAMLLHWRWTVAPAPGAINLKGAVFGDFALDCAWLWWMGWLFDPHSKPRTRASLQVEVILYGFVATLIAIFAMMWWAIERREQEVERDSRIVVEATSSRSSYSLKRCFFDGPHPDQVWSPLAADMRAERMLDGVYHTSVTITDEGAQRRVAVTTLFGRPLPPKMAATYANCLTRSDS